MTRVRPVRRRTSSVHEYVYEGIRRVEFGSAAEPSDRRVGRFVRPAGLERERYSAVSFVIFVPSSVTPAINPLFVRTNASIGAVAVLVSTLPFAPTFSTATD